MNKGKRLLYVDVLKICSAWLVIYCHLPAYHYSFEQHNQYQIFFMIISMFARLCIPVFFMCSGILLLGKEESWQEVFRKRVLKMIFTILVFGALCYLLKVSRGGYGDAVRPSLWHFITRLLGNEIDGAYWYLYAYLGFLLLLPLIRRGVRQITASEIRMLFVIHFLTSTAVPVINLLLEYLARTDDIYKLAVPEAFSVPFAMIRAFFYPILGYYIDTRVDTGNIKTRHILLLLCSVALCIAVPCLCTLAEGRLLGYYTQNYVLTFDYMLAVCIFLLVRHFLSGERFTRPGAGRALSAVAGLTFGIYLLDPILRALMFWELYDMASGYLNTFTGSVLWCFFSMILCGLITALLKKTPVKNLCGL